jgi:hypothetical protein
MTPSEAQPRTQLRAHRIAFLVASGLLMFAMLFASDIIVETAQAAPVDAIAMTMAALAAIAMAGAVVTAMDPASRGRP